MLNSSGEWVSLPCSQFSQELFVRKLKDVLSPVSQESLKSRSISGDLPPGKWEARNAPGMAADSTGTFL